MKKRRKYIYIYIYIWKMGKKWWKKCSRSTIFVEKCCGKLCKKMLWKSWDLGGKIVCKEWVIQYWGKVCKKVVGKIRLKNYVEKSAGNICWKVVWKNWIDNFVEKLDDKFCGTIEGGNLLETSCAQVWCKILWNNWVTQVWQKIIWSQIWVDNSVEHLLGKHLMKNYRETIWMRKWLGKYYGVPYTV